MARSWLFRPGARKQSAIAPQPSAQPQRNPMAIQQLQLQPPSPGLCQECAVDHPETEPHNAQSFYYRCKFSAEHGRPPTWADAMAHCPEAVKVRWTRKLEDIGVDINSPDLVGGIKSDAELDQRLDQASVSEEFYLE